VADGPLSESVSQGLTGGTGTGAPSLDQVDGEATWCLPPFNSSPEKPAQKNRESFAEADSEPNGRLPFRRSHQPLWCSQKTVIRIIRVYIISADIPLEVKTARNSSLATTGACTRCVKGRDRTVRVANNRLHNRLSFRYSFSSVPRGSFKPSFSMRETSVVGFSPNTSAAPSMPLIFQPVFRKTARRCLFVNNPKTLFGRRACWAVTLCKASLRTRPLEV
jgi:hypothetical protein